MSTSVSTQNQTTPNRAHEVASLKDIAIQDLGTNLNKRHLHLVGPEGQLHVHTASYRGSFSLVLSSAIRAAGLGSRVMIAQFLKGGVQQGPSGAINLCGNLTWIRPAILECLSETGKPQENEIIDKTTLKAVNDIWLMCRDHLLAGDIDQLVLDELGLAIAMGYIKKKEVISTLEKRPKPTDIILTGPAIPEEVLGMADQITELRSGL